jgi:hypothetical protein
MSNEEFERKMAFIIEQLAVDTQQLQATQAHTENVVGRLPTPRLRASTM